MSFARLHHISETMTMFFGVVVIHAKQKTAKTNKMVTDP
jgi:hypothetical protein